MAGQFHRVIVFFSSLMLMLLLAACGATEDRALPTVAQLPTTEPAQADATDSDDTEPTPTRETDISTPRPDPTATTDQGVGDMNPEEMLPFSLEGAGFAADINGVETLRISGAGTITCDDSGAYVIGTSADAIPRISFILPNDTPPGKYPLRDVIAAGVNIRPVLILTSGVTYDVQMDGIFVLTVLPAASGGPVKGDFEYSVAALVDPTQTLLIRGGFDFTAPAGFCS